MFSIHEGQTSLRRGRSQHKVRAHTGRMRNQPLFRKSNLSSLNTSCICSFQTAYKSNQPCSPIAPAEILAIKRSAVITARMHQQHAVQR